MILVQIENDLSAAADPRIAEISQRFFKAAAGEYGEGDQFRGIRVPVLRGFSRKYKDIGLNEAGSLLRSPYHEDRLLALFFLIRLYAKGDESVRLEVYNLYRKRTRLINNTGAACRESC